MKKRMVIVGLGLIGGSMALALKGFEDYEIVGVARRQATVDYALAHGVGDEATLDLDAVLPQADVTMLCMGPDGIVAFLAAHRDEFKPGSLVTDVCGVKSAIMAGAQVLPPEVDFIGCHPMAGTEFSGVENALADMFQGSHLILTPGLSSTAEHIGLMERMGAYIGCQDVVKTTPAEHDAMIAYTSQMMHIIAVSVCNDPMLFTCKGFEGSSFRGCTRVAALDVGLWTELFSANSPALVACLDRFIANLEEYRAVLAARDREALAQKLEHSASRKRALALPGPDLLQ